MDIAWLAEVKSWPSSVHSVSGRELEDTSFYSMQCYFEDKASSAVNLILLVNQAFAL